MQTPRRTYIVSVACYLRAPVEMPNRSSARQGLPWNARKSSAESSRSESQPDGRSDLLQLHCDTRKRVVVFCVGRMRCVEVEPSADAKSQSLSSSSIPAPRGEVRRKRMEMPSLAAGPRKPALLSTGDQVDQWRGGLGVERGRRHTRCLRRR